MASTVVGPRVQTMPADSLKAQAPTSRLQQSAPIDTPVTRVATPAAGTTTTTRTTADPVVTQTVKPQPARGGVSTVSSTDLGPVTTQIDPPPTRPPKKGRRKNRDNNTPQLQEDPRSVQESPTGDHPHVSRWETRTAHQLDHRTGDHTSAVVDDTNVRTFQVVERGAESTSGKKWRANHLEVTSDQGKAVPAAVRFLRRPAEANATSTSEPKASKFSGLRAKAQQGAQTAQASVGAAREKFSAAGAQAQRGAQSARAGAVAGRERFQAANERAKPHIENAGARLAQARTKFADVHGKAQQAKSELDEMMAKMKAQPQQGGAGKGRKKGGATKGKKKPNRSRQGTVTVKVELVQPGGGGASRGSGGTDKALARRLASGR